MWKSGFEGKFSEINKRVGPNKVVFFPKNNKICCTIIWQVRVVVVIFNIKVLMNEFSAFIVSLSFYFIHCLYIMKSNHVLNMQVHKSTLHLCPRDSYDVVCKRLLVESVTMAGNAKIWPKIQTMTEAAIFTIGRSRTIGYGKIRPLADYWSRSRLLNFENIFYLRKWNMK